jgi:hypothetical protein
MEKTSVKTSGRPKRPKQTGQYESLEAFRKAKMLEAIEATKHIDWDQVLANARNAK